MLQYDFMRYAFIAGIFIALICGVMGVFVVARQTSFSRTRCPKSVFPVLRSASLPAFHRFQGCFCSPARLPS